MNYLAYLEHRGFSHIRMMVIDFIFFYFLFFFLICSRRIFGCLIAADR